jgi:hypothetical protein
MDDECGAAGGIRIVRETAVLVECCLILNNISILLGITTSAKELEMFRWNIIPPSSVPYPATALSSCMLVSIYCAKRTPFKFHSERQGFSFSSTFASS